MFVTNSQATSMVTQCIKAGLVPMLAGSPGTGKSELVKQIAETYNLKVIDLRLSQCDPTDLNGFPKIKTDRAGYVPMDTFPIAGDPLPEGKDGWLLFLDEFNSAKEATQAAAYKIVLDKMVGQYDLHSKVAIVCAGNKDTDNAIVNPMSTAMQSRLVHIELGTDVKEWQEWAATEGIDHRITSFINFKPGLLYNFDPDHSDKTYACPRTWFFADKLIKITELSSPDFLPLMAGTVSEGVAREFVGFCKIHTELLKISEILANPLGVPVPENPGILYALLGSISHSATEQNFETLMKFISRIPPEFQTVCIKESKRRNKKLSTHPSLLAWAKAMGEEFF